MKQSNLKNGVFLFSFILMLFTSLKSISATRNLSRYHDINERIEVSPFSNKIIKDFVVRKKIDLLKGDLSSNFYNLKGWLTANSIEALKGKKEFKINSSSKGRIKILYNGTKKNKAEYLTTKDMYGDVTVELDFMFPKDSNAGIYMMGRYELQIFDSYGVDELSFSDLGGVYQRWDFTKKNKKECGFEGVAPLVNAAKEPGKWQNIKIVFRAPRFNSNGIKIENAKFVTVHVNGELVQKDIEVTGPTRGHPLEGKEVEFGPISIQGNHGPIAIKKYIITSSNKSKNDWVNLFNEKNLDGWDAYINSKGGNENSLNVKEIFTVTNKSIHTYKNAKPNSSQHSANLVSKETYSKYRLQVEYRWLNNKFSPRDESDRDAGVLFHIHTNKSEVWPPSLEMQLGDSKKDGKYVSGDLYVIGNSRADFSQNNKLIKLGGELNTSKELIKSKNGRKGATSMFSEKPIGEWNLLEIIVDGSKKAQFYLNGELVNEVFNMEYIDANGNIKPLKSGHISLQAEWAEIEYKTIRLKRI